MAIREDLFSTVSPAAVSVKQEPAQMRKPKKRIVTQAERFKIGKLLEENLSPQDANGLVSYLNGMSDYKIAKLIGPHVSHDTVRNMRQQVFGIVRKKYPLTPKGEVFARVAKLEEASLRLEEILGNHNITINLLIDMFNKLAEEVGSEIRF